MKPLQLGNVMRVGDMSQGGWCAEAGQAAYSAIILC